MRILGLDLSLTATGAVVLEGDELEPTAEVRLLSATTIKTELRGAERLAYLANRIEAIAGDYGSDQPRTVDLVAVEGYSFSSISLAHSIGELGGVVKVTMLEVGLTTVVIPPASWRKQLLGNGALRKELVPLEMFKRYGVEQASTDALEAYAVALAAFRTHCGLDRPQPKTRRQRVADRPDLLP